MNCFSLNLFDNLIDPNPKTIGMKDNGSDKRIIDGNGTIPGNNEFNERINDVSPIKSIKEPIILKKFLQSLVEAIARKLGNTSEALIKAIKLPTASIYPSSRKGGESEKCIDKKPTDVVAEVIKTGSKFTLNDSTIESFLLIPALNCCF